jgi:thiamine biosynthesis lipoprotein
MHPASASIRRARPLLGTFVDIGVAGAPPSAAEPAIEAAFAAVARVHRCMSFHECASDLSRINREARERAVRVDPWTFAVLQAALDLNRRSAGAFDVAVAPALQRMGVLPRPAEGPPSTVAACASADDIELLDGCRVRFRRPGMAIDLGGIAKGFAVDRAVDALREHAMPSGLVNAGGDLKAFGPQPHTVHVRDPRDAGRLICAVELREEALATSGGRFDPFRSGNPLATAIIDPATGRPAQASHGATVRAASCMIADALTKVVAVAPERATALLDRFDAGALVVLADGDIRISRHWRDTVRLAA